MYLQAIKLSIIPNTSTNTNKQVDNSDHTSTDPAVSSTVDTTVHVTSSSSSSSSTGVGLRSPVLESGVEAPECVDSAVASVVDLMTEHLSEVENFEAASQHTLSMSAESVYNVETNNGHSEHADDAKSSEVVVVEEGTTGTDAKSSDVVVVVEEGTTGSVASDSMIELEDEEAVVQAQTATTEEDTEEDTEEAKEEEDAELNRVINMTPVIVDLGNTAGVME